MREAKRLAEELLVRVKLMVSDPRAYWEDVAEESGDFRALLVRRVLPLAAVPALGLAIGSVLANLSAVWNGHPIARGILVTAALHYLVNVLVWVGLSQLIEALARPFNSRAGQPEALRLALGTLFPLWLAGGAYLLPFGLLPPLASLVAFGYSAYLLYVGVQLLLGTARDQAAPYAASVMLIGVVVAFTAFGLVGSLRACL